MDKEDEVCVHNGILLSHKKEQNNAICSNVDGPRDYHVESKKNYTSELIYKRNNRLTDRENKHGYQWGMGGE